MNGWTSSSLVWQVILYMPPRLISHISASTTSPPQCASTRRSMNPSASQMLVSTITTCSSWTEAHPATSSPAASCTFVRARMERWPCTARVRRHLNQRHGNMAAQHHLTDLLARQLLSVLMIFLCCMKHLNAVLLIRLNEEGFFFAVYGLTGTKREIKC